MKKNLVKKFSILNLVALSFSFCSCSFEKGEDKNKKEFSNVDNIFISEFYQGENINDCALEISTLSEEYVSLNGYKINIYSNSKIIYSYTFSSEKLSKSNVFLLINEEFNYEYENSIKVENNYLYGKFYTELLDEKDHLIDSIGFEGFNVEFAPRTIVKLKEYYFRDGIFDETHFISVKPGTDKFLGNLDFPYTKEELLFGPHLDSLIYGEYPMFSGSNGLGGYTDVTLSSLGDGDTTYFRFPIESGMDSSLSVRYLMINTPEISHGADDKGEPRGYKAKLYNNEVLRNAKRIVVQTARNSALHETYGRYLGLVWYSDNINAKDEELRLLNYEMVYEAYAYYSRYQAYKDLYYEDFLYTDYFDFASKIKEHEGVRIYGEIDDSYDY